MAPLDLMDSASLDQQDLKDLQELLEVRLGQLAPKVQQALRALKGSRA
jgi:hypothetical protein